MLEQWIVELVQDAGGTLTGASVEVPDVIIKSWKFSTENKAPKGKTKGKAAGNIQGNFDGEPKQAPVKWKFKMAII